ncbi:MAG: hypothetical protein ACLRXY_09160 [Acutalibacteraceae bacterium]
MSGRFDELRREYPHFVYSGYSVSEHEDGLHLSFDFSIPGLCEFHPQTRLDGKSLDIFNSPRVGLREENGFLHRSRGGGQLLEMRLPACFQSRVRRNVRG